MDPSRERPATASGAKLAGAAALLAVLAVLAGCTVYVPEPDALMAGGDEARLVDLKAGRELYILKCSGCHALIPVDRFDGPRWQAEVEEMFRLDKLRMSRGDRERLLLYLDQASRRPRVPGAPPGT